MKKVTFSHGNLNFSLNIKRPTMAAKLGLTKAEKEAYDMRVQFEKNWENVVGKTAKTVASEQSITEDEAIAKVLEFNEHQELIQFKGICRMFTAVLDLSNVGAHKKHFESDDPAFWHNIEIPVMLEAIESFRSATRF